MRYGTELVRGPFVLTDVASAASLDVIIVSTAERCPNSADADTVARYRDHDVIARLDYSHASVHGMRWLVREGQIACAWGATSTSSKGTVGVTFAGFVPY